MSKYQEFHNFMHQEHGLILLESEMRDILIQAQEVLSENKDEYEVYEKETCDPPEVGYYLTKTEEDKWGIAYWDGNKFWDDPAQDGKLAFGLRRDFIKEWYLLPS